MASKAELVDQVKQVQRAGGKETWAVYSDTHLGGVRDPNRHDEATLGGFLQQYHSGALANLRPAAPASYGPSFSKGAVGGWAPSPQVVGGVSGGPVGGASVGGGVCALVKEGQRRSPQWRESWQKYCAIFGGGKMDPSRHEESFLSSFLDYAGGLASSDLESQAAAQGVDLEGKGVKRAAPVEWKGPPAKFANLGGSLDGEKGDLVSRVKAFQRSGPEAKEAWAQYCDQAYGGVRDPSRHEVEALRTFLTSQGA